MITAKDEVTENAALSDNFFVLDSDEEEDDFVELDPCWLEYPD